MKSVSRRKFFRTIATGLGAISLGQFLAGCTLPDAAPAPTSSSTAPSVSPPTPTPIPTQVPQPTTSSPVPTFAATTGIPQANTTPTIESSPTQVVPPDIAVTHGPDPEALVRQALAALGGMQRFVAKGAKVIVKPNICVAYGTYENAYTTNPWVVGALVKLCFEAGAASVRVMDFPFNGTASNAYQKSGIAEQVKAAGGEMALMTGYKYISTRLNQARDLKSIGIYDDILKADALINVPIVKHHSLAGVTLAMKNLLGVIDDRGTIHLNFGQRLPDLVTQIKPVLNVVDAIRILMNNGPASGTKDDVKKMDTVIATPDIVAADAYSVGLLGKKPDDFKFISTAAEMQLGRKDIQNLKIEEVQVAG